MGEDDEARGMLDMGRSLTALDRPTVTPSAVRGSPLVAELIPAPDPWETARCLADLPHLLFLDSAQAHANLGRYSFVTADPFGWIWSRGRRVLGSNAFQPVENSNPFEFLADRLALWQTATRDDLPPFQGGAAGLFGYDLCHHIERLPRSRLDPFQMPELALGFYDWVIAFDHEASRAWIISTGFPEMDRRRRQRHAARRLTEVQRRLMEEKRPILSASAVDRPKAVSVADLGSTFAVPACDGIFSNFDQASYLQAVRRVIDYIRAGDCFQVNLAQTLLCPAALSALELYQRLRERNPATFAGYFDMGEFALASASPERFLRVDRGRIETRPIKGTRPRGSTPAEDQRQIEELRASTKDRAENVMIVDLLRNDLGRVCRYGSVQVPKVCQLETYAFVHHLVSEVRGELRDGMTPIDLLRAAFPGGSVTGAPKIRAMEIIAELEPTARGPYCGSLGYISFDGRMDTNILIRTFTVGRGWVQFPVGGGIVADSEPEREYEETWHKAEGLLQALR
jgi:para-aminobenzoate synthetase component 1